MKNYQEKIEEYLSGKLSNAQSDAFEQQMEREPALRAAYEEELLARTVIRTAGREQLKARLEEMDAAGPQAAPGPRSPRNRWWIAAAAVVIGLTLGLWWWTSSTPPTGPQLFAQYFETYRPPQLERGTASTELSDWEKGLDYYSKQQFTPAAAAFEKSLKLDQAPQYLVQFYLGQSYLAQDPPQAALALAALKQAAQGEHFYQPVAQWYMALANLQLGQSQEAKLLLQDLASQGDVQPAEVVTLLKALGE